MFYLSKSQEKTLLEKAPSPGSVDSLTLVFILLNAVTAFDSNPAKMEIKCHRI